jgi:hypothetical protein
MFQALLAYPQKAGFSRTSVTVHPTAWCLVTEEHNRLIVIILRNQKLYLILTTLVTLDTYSLS